MKTPSCFPRLPQSVAAWVSYCACFACFLVPVLGFFLLMLWLVSKQGRAERRDPRSPVFCGSLAGCSQSLPLRHPAPGAYSTLRLRPAALRRYSYLQPRALRYPQRWQQTNCTLIDSDVQLQWFNPLSSRAQRPRHRSRLSATHWAYLRFYALLPAASTNPTASNNAPQPIAPKQPVPCVPLLNLTPCRGVQGDLPERLHGELPDNPAVPGPWGAGPKPDNLVRKRSALVVAVLLRHSRHHVGSRRLWPVQLVSCIWSTTRRNYVKAFRYAAALDNGGFVGYT